jgi:hypothetical protein
MFSTFWGFWVKHMQWFLWVCLLTIGKMNVIFCNLEIKYSETSLIWTSWWPTLVFRVHRCSGNLSNLNLLVTYFSVQSTLSLLVTNFSVQSTLNLLVTNFSVQSTLNLLVTNFVVQSTLNLLVTYFSVQSTLNLLVTYFRV